jgi:hypothetical protein
MVVYHDFSINILTGSIRETILPKKLLEKLFSDKLLFKGAEALGNKPLQQN